MKDTFKTKSIEDTEMIYSLLRDKYPKYQIEIEFNDNTKEYLLKVTDKEFKEDPEVPVDIKIKIVYGDSVTGDTPILLKKDNIIYIETIQSIFNEKEKIEYSGFKLFDKCIRLEKEYSLSDYQVWSDIGWVDIKKVIRHKCDKKIYNILTHNGSVNVTEDHSLIDENGKPIKPLECNLETRLLTSYPTFNYEYKNYISKDRAYIYGFFYGDGSCDKYDCSSGLKYSWALNNSNLDLLEKLKQLIIKEYQNHIPIIYDTIKSSGVYKLSVNNQKQFIEEYRNKFYDLDRYKKVPTEILNSSNEVIQSFLEGYWAADGCRKDKSKIGCTRFDNKGQIGSAGLYYLMKRLGYKTSINTCKDKDNIFCITVTKNNQHKIENQIKQISVIEKKSDNIMLDYVYDIETSIGRFNAGIGEIICFNTDSVFLSLKYNRQDFIKNRLDTFKLGTICGDNLTEKVFKRPPIEMEFEKVFQPFILLTKKRYIGKKYDNLKDPLKLKEITKSGIAITRRDYCKMVKNCYSEVINAIVNEDGGGVDESIEIYKSYIDRIDNYQIDIDDLIVSAMLAKSYKTKPVHVHLAEKLKKRHEEVQTGDRIPYIYIEGEQGVQKSELGEDPKYAIENNLKYNRKCYLEQLAKPLLGFFKCILSDNEDELDDIINYTNDKLVEYGGVKLKASDFKIKETD